jgi:hypothetical protein
MALSLALALVSGLLAGDEPPGDLRCLARHYPVQIERGEGGAWGLRVGSRWIPHDDGSDKGLEETLRDPDLEDMMRFPYPRGPIAPRLEQHGDPGRARVEALFDAVYLGAPGGRPELARVALDGELVRVHRRVAPSLERVDEALGAHIARNAGLRAFLHPLGGGHVDRRVRGETRRSPHAWGIAVDIATATADYWRWDRGPLRWRNRVPEEIVQAFEAQGWIWGGRWAHYDTMHFEYRPELLDPACEADSTVIGGPVPKESP